MQEKTKHNKLFVVRKYIWAKDARQAIKLEKKLPADDVYIDEDWKRGSPIQKGSMCFYTKGCE